MINILCACTDLGVSIDGCDKGPIVISKKIKNKNVNNCIYIKKDNIIKEKEKNNLRKNFNGVKNVLEKIYVNANETLDKNIFPITIGGDHTVAISSALASLNHYKDLGVIWIDAHTDFNTFETTETGNIHGLPLATICGLCEDLSSFHQGNYLPFKKCVIVGARSIDKLEKINLEKYGISYFSTNDLKNKGIKNIMDKAFTIAGENVHISFDLDVADPSIAPGVSVPEKNGLLTEEINDIFLYLQKQKNKIKALDIVEYNPSLDIDEKTLNIALDLLEIFLD